VVRLGVAVESEQQAGAYLRRMRMARPMTATASWPMLTSRLARAMCDGLLVPSHRHQEVEKREITVGNKSTLPTASG
jgi:hypothetical protein